MQKERAVQDPGFLVTSLSLQGAALADAETGLADLELICAQSHLGGESNDKQVSPRTSPSRGAPRLSLD